MYSNTSRVCASVAFLLSFFLSSAEATPLFSGSPTGDSFSSQDSSGGIVMHYDFTVGAEDIRVTDLGVWDSGQDGLGFAYDVGLYDSSSLLASVTIQAGTASILIGEFRYEVITPITLSAFSNYTLAAFYGESTDDIYLRDTLSNVIASGGIASEVTLTDGGLNILETSLPSSSPTFSDGLIRFGPNLQFDSVVPEPTTLALMGLGLAGIGYRRHRSKIAA